jgi:hypothetical protein
LQIVDATVGGRRGTFVFETREEFDGAVARWEASLLPGSCTGELTHATGTGRLEAPFGSTASYELELSLGDD